MESATILTPPSTGLSRILPQSEPNIPEGPEYEKISKFAYVVRFSLPIGFLPNGLITGSHARSPCLLQDVDHKMMSDVD